MRAFLLTLLLMSVVVPQAAFSEEGESRIKAEDLTQDAEQSEDVDLLITNKQLRAESGSKSRWSLGSSFGYSGSNLRKPLAEDRPNIAATTATTDKALLDGHVEVKYNMAVRHSLSAGIGLRWIAPLSKGGPKNYDGTHTDMANPYLAYQFVYNLGGMQSVLQVQSAFYTESNLVRLGYVSSLSINQDSVFEIADSRLSLGFSIWGQYGLYNKSGETGSPDEHGYIEDVRTEQADYIFGLSPLVEYEINNTFNLRLVTNLWNFEHLRSESRLNTYAQDRITQSFGVGISVTRDIFVFPNVEYVPEDMRAEMTNIGITADINVF